MRTAYSLASLLLVSLALGSCSQDSYVILDVDGDCDVVGLGVSQLRVTLQNQENSDSKLFTGKDGASFTLPVTLAIILGHDRSGSLSIQVDGLNSSMMVVGSGAATGTLQVGARTNFFVQMTAGARTCGNGVLDQGEGCDDGNRQNGDGCDSICRPESGPIQRLDAGSSRDGGSDVEGMSDADQGTVVPLAPGVGFRDVTTGGGFTCAARVDGSLYCWGDNSGNQLAVTGTKATSLTTPAQVPGSQWQTVSSGLVHACAIAGDGGLACWGVNDSGQLGDNKLSKTGAKATLAGNTWSSVGAGYYHSCGSKTDNSLWCWGQNFSGQLGDGTTVDHPVPNAVGNGADAGIRGWKTISVGYLHNCAIDLDSTLYCWGGNGQGQLGLGTLTFAMQPSSLAGSWTVISAGFQHTCGIRAAGSLWCWGDNGSSQLGGGAANKEAKPVQVGDATDWLTVSAGQSHTCGIKTDGSLWCWGDNGKGQLGLGDASSNRPSPTQVTEPAGNWYKIAAGSGYTCGIQSAGSLWCWGDNGKGQLGDGSTTRRSRPVLISN